MLTVVCWKWQKPGYRTQFAAEHVNTLRRMVARHYRDLHQFVCVTDDGEGIDPGIRVIPIWDTFATVRNPYGTKNPSCYRRLKIFSKEARAMFGERLVSVDLDTVICGDLRPLWNRPEEFVIWGDTARGTPYNGSMILLTTGSRLRVWKSFDPLHSPAVSRSKGYFGSDQAHIAVALGPGEAKWTSGDGVFSFRNEIQKNGGELPPGARIVFFHGKHNPWDADIQARHPWVKDHWR